jgi:SpoVK/Ycf46/Vps4 family AAA+-type ATPase
MPLLRLDLGALRSKWIGESEANIRRALQVAERVAPAILWLDEVEKALGGSTGPQGDGGVASDALGTILTWLQEKAGAVFVVATANDVTALPPELLRKGRFEEVFFADLPNVQERAAIAAVAIRQAKRDPSAFDLDAIAAATQDFTGAELSALVPDALFAAFSDGREVTTADMLAAARGTVPLARTASEKIDALRAWSKGRARSASHTATVAPKNAGPRYDL